MTKMVKKLLLRDITVERSAEELIVGASLPIRDERVRFRAYIDRVEAPNSPVRDRCFGPLRE